MVELPKAIARSNLFFKACEPTVKQRLELLHFVFPLPLVERGKFGGVSFLKGLDTKISGPSLTTLRFATMLLILRSEFQGLNLSKDIENKVVDMVLGNGLVNALKEKISGRTAWGERRPYLLKRQQATSNVSCVVRERSLVTNRSKVERASRLVRFEELGLESDVNR